ncbi:Hypothetical protein PHPALM_8851 [Phytophthora palmivora]|uniref:Uncharacterized protein n=1 Tax=Phytophthora palmivora TaxID=4796 RepID=A0A2P4Y8T3_9STRA|nr:Hypothetical protein PHPALM_8851 [Phytophthora palmivora]
MPTKLETILDVSGIHPSAFIREHDDNDVGDDFRRLRHSPHRVHLVSEVWDALAIVDGKYNVD